MLSFLGYFVGFVAVDLLWFGRGRLTIGKPALYLCGVAICATLAAAEYAWVSYRIRRYRPPGSCAVCGHDRVGPGVGAVCPQCGNTSTKA